MALRHLVPALWLFGGCAPTTGVAPGEQDLGLERQDGGRAFDLQRPDENACGDFDPSCTGKGFSPPQTPFPLSSDPQPDPAVHDTGVERDPDGYLQLGGTGARFDFLWIANTDDWGRGTVSKINSRTVKEVARYFSVTCLSNPSGSTVACDGANGCCARDSDAQYQNRKGGQPGGPAQAVQLVANSPSRTAVDWNGDVWIANRAFGGQSSVTQIANDVAGCADRNGEPGVQTSSDVNGDGVIDADCNGNGVPDDLADVRARPCANGRAQEFYGLDDECVRFTTNTGPARMVGRPLALSKGAVDFGPSDAWAGLFADGRFFRIDGATGLIRGEAQGPTGAYGAAVDDGGILWIALIEDGRLGYFDTANPSLTGLTRAPMFALNGYGIAMDRDRNVWTGGWTNMHAYRYTPDRSAGFANLGAGWWTMVSNPGLARGATGNGRGIAADARTRTSYFVWMARDGGWIARIDASAIPLPNGADQEFDGRNLPAVRVAGSSTIGVGVDVDQHVWGVSYGGSVVTRVRVDANGNMTEPDIASGVNNQGCPVGATGDRCPLGFKNDLGLNPYTYSDFTGFGLRNFTNPRGAWSRVQRGCAEGDTRWVRLVWDGAAPPNTTLAARVRTGPTPVPDGAWSAWSAPVEQSPMDLSTLPRAPWLQVEFDFATQDRTVSPKLKSFTIYFECSNIPG